MRPNRSLPVSTTRLISSMYGDVSRHGQHVSVAALRDRRGCFSQSVRLARAKHQRCAFGSELFSDGASQSTTACGDQCDFVLESEIHDLLLSADSRLFCRASPDAAD